jgi:hypothetical protein
LPVGESTPVKNLLYSPYVMKSLPTPTPIGTRLIVTVASSGSARFAGLMPTASRPREAATEVLAMPSPRTFVWSPAGAAPGIQEIRRTRGSIPRRGEKAVLICSPDTRIPPRP